MESARGGFAVAVGVGATRLSVGSTGLVGSGIIGCGAVAEEYVKAFQKDDRSEVRALVSRNPANAQRYRDRYNLHCAIETDAEKMLRMKDVDLVVVCTPHDTHTRYVVAAAEAGKHVIIEKPVALTMDDVRKQLQAVRKSKVVVAHFARPVTPARGSRP